jgi:hypothetical protein
MRSWGKFPRSAKIKTFGYGVSVVSVILLSLVSWKNASTDPILAFCLLAGACTSITAWACAGGPTNWRRSRSTTTTDVAWSVPCDKARTEPEMIFFSAR